MIADGYRLLPPHMRAPRWWLPRLARGGLAFVAVCLGIVAVIALVGPRIGITYAVVKSGSMTPTYPTGDIIVISSVDPSSVKVGDVISFRAPAGGPDEIVSHRVVDIRREDDGLKFVTKGDANEERDSRAVEASRVKGRVVLGIPWVGRLAPVVQEKGIFFGIVVICGVLLIITEVIKVIRELRGSRESPLG